MGTAGCESLKGGIYVSWGRSLCLCIVPTIHLFPQIPSVPVQCRADVSTPLSGVLDPRRHISHWR